VLILGPRYHRSQTITREKVLLVGIVFRNPQAIFPCSILSPYIGPYSLRWLGCFGIIWPFCRIGRAPSHLSSLGDILELEIRDDDGVIIPAVP